MGTRQTQKANTRRKLKLAARACLETISFTDLQIADVTRGAGVASGTFYVHFPNKEALLDELFVEFNERQTEKIGEVWLGEAMGSERALRAVAGTLLDEWMQERQLLEAFLRRAASSSSLRALRDGINPPVAAFLTHAIRSYGDANGRGIQHPELVTQAILGMWMRVALQYLFRDEVGREAAVETLTTMTLGAVRAAVPVPATAEVLA